MDITLLNMGLLGATISHTRQLSVGADFLLLLNSGEGTMGLNAEVVWQKLSGHHRNTEGDSVPYYTSGLRFLDVLTPAGMKLRDFLLEDREEAETRLTSRIFRIGRSVKASLMEFMTCPVITLSVGGMGIERRTHLAPEQHLPIEVSLPDASQFMIKGRVTCCLEQAKESGLYYNIGIEFAEISEADRRQLGAFVQQLNQPQADLA